MNLLIYRLTLHTKIANEKAHMPKEQKSKLPITMHGSNKGNLNIRYDNLDKSLSKLTLTLATNFARVDKTLVRKISNIQD